MKVMLVTQQNFIGNMGYEPASGGPQLCEEYTVITECIGFTRLGAPVKCFMLAEFPEDELYDQHNFAILPDATAEEMEEEVKEAIIA